MSASWPADRSSLPVDSHGAGHTPITKAPAFGRGDEILAWFASRRPIDRLDVITRVEARQHHYHARILALKAVKAPPVTDPAEAQKLVALEAFYRATLPLLQTEHLALRSATLSRTDLATLEGHKSAFHEELLYLAPLIDEGYWAPLKQRWRARIDAAEPKQAAATPLTTTDPIDRLQQRLSAKRASGAAIFDTRRARAIIDLIPDMTAPLDPLALDPEPLLPT
jgi:hypothetical protein